jgi:hypothetical protein
MTHDPDSAMRAIEAERQRDKDARATAERMLAKYGSKRALELATGYATDAFFEPAKAHWQRVVKIMLEIGRRKGPEKR